MGGYGKCVHCLHSYEEYGFTECKKDVLWDKFSEDEEVDDCADKFCKYYEEYPADADEMEE